MKDLLSNEGGDLTFLNGRSYSHRLDCGPISGFDNAKVNAGFFARTTIKSNFLCALGYGDVIKLHACSPRLTFGETCQVI